MNIQKEGRDSLCQFKFSLSCYDVNMLNFCQINNLSYWSNKKILLILASKSIYSPSLIYLTNINFKLMDEKKAMIRDLIFVHKKWRQTKKKLKFNLYYRISIKIFPPFTHSNHQYQFLQPTPVISLLSNKNWVAHKNKKRSNKKERKERDKRNQRLSSGPNKEGKAYLSVSDTHVLSMKFRVSIFMIWRLN